MSKRIYSFTESTYHPCDDEEVQPCKIIDCDEGKWRFVPLYFMLGDEQQVEMQEEYEGKWYPNEVYPYRLADLTAELAYKLVRNR